MKKTNFVRALLLLLTVAVLATTFIACADNDDKPDATPTVTEAPSGTPTPTEEPRLDHGISRKYDYEVNVLHWYVDPLESWIPWEEIAVEERDTGDLLVADIFDRNAWMEENYNITLTNTYSVHTTIQNQITTAITSGDDDFQLLAIFSYGVSSGGNLFGQDLFCNMNEIETIDLSHPWWVADSVSALKIGEVVEMAASDLLLLDKGATTAVFYNKTMASDLGIKDLYSLAQNKEWTIEAMAEYADLATSELDGNDTMDGNDQWGVVCGDDPVLSFYLSSGNRFINTDDDGYFYYEFGSEDTIEVMSNILETLMYGDFYFNGWLRRNEDVQPSFDDGQALFSPGMIKTCIGLRRSEIEYGVLPNPLCDDDQEEYGSWVHSYHDSLLAIPNTVAEPESVGAALELLGWYSYYNIYSDLYDTVICDRGTRDEQSVEMLKIIFSNRIYELGVVKDTNDFTDKVLRYTSTGSTNIKTLYDQYEDILDAHIEKLNDIVDKY